MGVRTRAARRARALTRHVNRKWKFYFKVDFVELRTSQVKVDLVDRLSTSKVELKVAKSRKVDKNKDKSLLALPKKSTLLGQSRKSRKILIDFSTFFDF